MDQGSGVRVETLLVRLGAAVRSHGLDVTRVEFAPAAVVHVGGERVEVPDEQALAALTGLEADMIFDPDDPWPELLYDLGANADLMARTSPGLRYVAVERTGPRRARVDLERDGVPFRFDVDLTRAPVGLPDTFGEWARRNPGGLAEAVGL